jgi:hypothetical protein
MNLQQQIEAQQLMLRVQNNPTSCSNAELSIPPREDVSESQRDTNKSTMNLVLRDINDYLEIGAWNALRIA